MTSGTLPLAMP
jgi:hypothetical protein